MKHILARVAKNRLYGQIFVYDEEDACFGPIATEGRADSAAATAHGNPSRDPEKAFGDTPCGDFIGTLAYEPNMPANVRSFGLPDKTGKIPIIHLRPVQGDSQAWRRQLSEGNIDMGLALHAGTPSETGGLRPTHGCLRIRQEDRDPLFAQLAGLPSFPVRIEEIA